MKATRPAASASDDKGSTEKKAKKAYPTEMPKYKNAEGKIAMAKEPVLDDAGKPTGETRLLPVRFKRNNFPKGKDGNKAYFDHLALFFGWRRDNIGALTQKDVERKENQLKKLLEKAALLEVALGKKPAKA